MDAKMYSKMPTEFFFQARDGQLTRKPRNDVNSSIDWLQSLKQFFIKVSYHILVANLTLMAEPSELDWLQVYDMTH